METDSTDLFCLIIHSSVDSPDYIEIRSKVYLKGTVENSDDFRGFVVHNFVLFLVN